MSTSRTLLASAARAADSVDSEKSQPDLTGAVPPAEPTLAHFEDVPAHPDAPPEFQLLLGPEVQIKSDFSKGRYLRFWAGEKWVVHSQLGTAAGPGVSAQFFIKRTQGDTKVAAACRQLYASLKHMPIPPGPLFSSSAQLPRPRAQKRRKVRKPKAPNTLSKVSTPSLTETDEPSGSEDELNIGEVLPCPHHTDLAVDYVQHHLPEFSRLPPEARKIIAATFTAFAAN